MQGPRLHLGQLRLQYRQRLRALDTLPHLSHVSQLIVQWPQQRVCSRMQATFHMWCSLHLHTTVTRHKPLVQQLDTRRDVARVGGAG